MNADMTFRTTLTKCQALSILLSKYSQTLFSEKVFTYFFLVQLQNPGSSEASTENEAKNISGAMDRIRSFLSSSALLCLHQAFEDGSAIFLLSFPDENACQPLLYELNIQLTFISEQIGVHYYIGTDRLASATCQEQAFGHAMECIRLLESIHARRGVCSYNNITFVRMFGILHQNDHSIVLDNQALQLLLNYDRNNQTNYVHTLRSYLADNCNISRTAERLYIHRHTLMKRLDKIQALSGINFNDYYARIYMSLALLFHDYFAF